MEKYADDKTYQFPLAGGVLRVPMFSQDKREEFCFDITRSSIRLTKATFQNRARKSLVLIRIDIDGPPHRNPDGTEVTCPHVHFYRENFGDKWAEPLPSWISDPNDLRKSFHELMMFCNVIKYPTFEQELPI
jgi:hypothetical protein